VFFGGGLLVGGLLRVLQFLSVIVGFAMVMLNNVGFFAGYFQLGVAEGTVKNHVSNILSKLGVRDRTRAVLKALELGIV
jgi:hypothetical protein